MTAKPGSLPQEVFLSHSSRNRVFAIKLAEVLRHHHVPVWFSETNLVGAQQWHDEIGRALQSDATGFTPAVAQCSEVRMG